MLLSAPVDCNDCDTVVVTACFGTRDGLLAQELRRLDGTRIEDPRVGRHGRVRWLAFTDRVPSGPVPAPWEVVLLRDALFDADLLKRPMQRRRKARSIKHAYHRFLQPPSRHVVWVDATILVRRDATELARFYLGDSDVIAGSNEHCEWRERGYVEECILLQGSGMDDDASVRKQLEAYRAADVSTEVPAPSVETSVYVRRDCARARRLGEAVLKEIAAYSARDQIGLFGAFHKLRYPKECFRTVPWKRLNDFASAGPHRESIPG